MYGYTFSFSGGRVNLAISGLLLREANMVACEESMIFDAGSVNTTSCFKMNSLENSFASPKYKSESAVNMCTDT